MDGMNETLPLAWFPLLVVGLYGLVLGSFLNVVVYRLPREISLVRPRSHCPGCGALVHWYDNVPVLSYLWLGGRCRACQVRISPRYPLVELLTAALLVLVAVRFGLTVVGAEAAVLVLLLIPLALIDLDHHLLHDVLTLPGIVLGLGFSILPGALSEVRYSLASHVAPSARELPGVIWGLEGALAPVRDALIGTALGAALPYLVIVTYRLIRGVEGMGLGDVKLLAMIGAFLGWRGVLLTLGLGSLLGAVVGLSLIALRRSRMDSELPFGTFLALAAGVALFSSPNLYVLLGWVRE
jgi:leader peptidase (prepilin peptidase) / N-methyltransferase